MKKQHLGKIVALLLLPLFLWSGSVKATLNKPLIYKGESATLTLTAHGKDIEFPDIKEIGGFTVLGTSQSQNITSINGNTTRTLSQSYQFAPTKSMDIPSYLVHVDGVAMKTAPLSLKVTKPTAASKDAPVQLQMQVDKKEVYVGEPVKLSLIFKHLPQTNFAKVELAEPNLKGLWAKKLPPAPQKVENGYIIETYSYLLFPQQAGSFTIPATFARLGSISQSRHRGGLFDDPFFNDPFFSSAFGNNITWKKLYSNDLSITAKPLPEGLEIYGDFTLKATVNKHKVPANKAVNLTITIAGEGNLDDIEKFDPTIDNAVVYADEPTVNASATEKGYRGVFKQKIAIVADTNFTIPSLSFSYFDKKSHTKKTLHSKEIAIEVIGGTTQTKVNSVVEEKPTKPTLSTSATKQATAKSVVQVDDKTRYIWLVAGIMIGVILTLLYSLLSQRLSQPKKQKTYSIIQQIEHAKDDKTLFNLLLPFTNDDSRIKEVVHKLEKNLYKNGNEKIDKDDILDYFEEVTSER